MKKLFLGLIIGMLLMAGGGFVWVKYGGGSLDYLIPLVEQALNPEDSEYETEMESVQLKWDQLWSWPSLEVSKLKTQHRDLGSVLTIDKIKAQIDLKAIIQRELQVRSVAIEGAHLNTHHIPIDTTQDEPWSKEYLASLLSEHYQTLDSLIGIYHGLKYLTLKDLSVELNDPKGQEWNIGINDLRLSLDYTDFLKKLELESYLDLDNHNPRLDISVNKTTQDQSPEWRIKIQGLQSHLIHHFIDLPKDLKLQSELDVDLLTNIHQSHFINPTLEFTSPQISFNYAPYYPQDILAQHLILHTQWTDNFSEVTLSQSSLEIAGLEFKISGSYLLSKLQGQLEISHPEMSLPWVQNHWPQELAQPGIEWIQQHLLQGQFPSTQVQIDTLALKAKVQFQALKVNPWSQIPTVSQARGYLDIHAPLDAPLSLQLDLQQAKILNSQISQTKIILDQLAVDTLTPHLYFSTQLQGDITEALEIIKPDIFNAKSLPLSIKAGQHLSQLKFNFPLDKSPNLKQLNLELNTQAQQVQTLLGDIGLPYSQSKSNSVKVKIDDSIIKIHGDVQANQQKAQFHFKMNLTPQHLSRPELTLNTRISSEEIKRLFDNNFLQGHMDAQVHIKLPKEDYQNTQIALSADLKDMGVYLGGKELKAPASRASQLQLKARTLKQNIHIDRLEITGKDLTLKAYGKIQTDPDRIEFEVEKLKAKTALLMHKTQLLRKGKFTSLSGNFLNIHSFLDLDTLASSTSSSSSQDEIIDPSTAHHINHRIDLKFNKVQLSEQGYLKDTYVFSQWDQGRLLDAKIKAQFGNQTPLVGVMQKNTKFPTIKIQTTDAGSFLRTFEYYNYMFGGHLDLDLIANHGFLRPKYRAKYKIKDFRIAEAPTLSKIVALGSFVGIGDAFSGKGTKFHRAKGTADISLSRIQVYNTYIQGPSVSLYTSGEVHTETKSLRFEGNVIPFTSFNESLGLSFEVSDRPSLDEPAINVKRLVTIHSSVKEELRKLERQP